MAELGFEWTMPQFPHMEDKDNNPQLGMGALSRTVKDME